MGKHVKEGNAIRVGKAVGWERGGREREGDMEGGREGGEMRERERERGISSPGSRIPDKPVFVTLATITIKLWMWRTIME